MGYIKWKYRKGSINAPPPVQCDEFFLRGGHYYDQNL
jgi:hypothetical protein